ncbi:nucleotidyltransferase family protein [Aeromicrobium fastidiosum]|uniref:Nucleotidyltransferase family protein n=1 Tax=Aeromicrobium fastidiosum TaxID=52699 RepID=A0A641APC1_9ACTN|nr:nucleotidyltransferase family protein [Aeromicrobium fastidiosum]KAA1379944.1 nucleotidyltransferase family protein [Aeromicrobium fastidiosum]MBP2389454.1 CTP:molybdopterin cytidylyltransferase MocA [Aeromicrobium fastidiosum]
MTVAGLLLAGGAGRRMGGPKALVRGADGLTWAERSVTALAQGGCDPVHVAVGASAPEVERTLSHRPVRIVPVPDWSTGMSRSLRAGLLSLPDHSTAVIIMLVDLPDVGADVVRRLAQHAAPECLARAAYEGLPGHPVLIGRSHWGAVVAGLEGDTGAGTYLAQNEALLVECRDLATGRDVDSISEPPG